MATETRQHLTAARAIDHARYTIGGVNYQFPGHIDPLGLVNEAGNYLVSMTEWQWLRGAIAKLDLVQDQPYSKLPADYKTAISQDHTNGLVSSLHIVSPDRFLQLQTSTITTATFEFYATVESVAPSEGGPPVPRLAIWPTPTADSEDALSIIYEATWRNVNEAKEALTLPEWLVTLYLEVLVHITRGRLEEDEGTAATRLQGLMASDLFMAAQKRDAATQIEYGPMRRTHVSPTVGLASAEWPYNYTTVQGPS
jgi:hypothetical protein